ncbi:MAG: CAP domain-containing protein, partial [Bacteroidetes bacterium]
NIDKNKLLQLVNNLRQAGCTCGSTLMPAVPVVTWDDILEKASQDHSKDMNQNNYFSHTSQDGRNPGQRITNAGYIWTTYGENIAKGQSTEEIVMESWKNSEGHCKNIMNVNVREMGVGKSGEYWTQIFAKK